MDAGDEIVKEDASATSRVDRGLFRVESVFNSVAGILILVMMVLTVVNILSRKLLNLPIYGFIDWLVMTVPFIAFLGLAFCQRLGGHIRMDIFIGTLKGRAMWAAELLTTIVGIGVIGILIYGSLDHALRALIMGDNTPVAYIDTWPSKAIVSFGFAMLLIRMGLQGFVFARALIRGEHDPVAVPLAGTARKAVVDGAADGGADDGGADGGGDHKGGAAEATAP